MTNASNQQVTGIVEIDALFADPSYSRSRDDYHRFTNDLAPIVAKNIKQISKNFNDEGFPRFPIVWSLIGNQTTTALNLFRDAISDPDKYTRWAAAEALAKCNHPDATDALVRALRDRSGLVKDVAVRAMIRLRPLEAMSQLRKIVASNYQQRHAPGTVTAAREALELIENGG